jgi:hypothetical protein
VILERGGDVCSEPWLGRGGEGDVLGRANVWQLPAEGYMKETTAVVS